MLGCVRFFLQVLDDSRKWWKTRNIRGQIGHVPHTIVAPVGDSDYHNNGYESTNNYSPVRVTGLSMDV